MTKANRSSNVFHICQSISNVALFDQHQKKTLECIKLFSSDIYDHNPSQIGPGVPRWLDSIQVAILHPSSGASDSVVIQVCSTEKSYQCLFIHMQD